MTHAHTWVPEIGIDLGYKRLSKHGEPGFGPETDNYSHSDPHLKTI